MSDHRAPDTEAAPDTSSDLGTAGSASTDEHPLAESGESPERVEHVGVSEHDEVDQAALDIAESTSADEPPA